MARDWSQAEVDAAVEDYFNMLKLELSGQSYNKTAHRHLLMEQLDGRTNGSVELKHQNISAVLIEMGIPYIDGYKPRFNYQRALIHTVGNYLQRHPKLYDIFEEDTKVAPPLPTVDDFLSCMVEPPSVERFGAKEVAETSTNYNPGGINYLELEARNQSLGDAGEMFVINYERARLINEGKDALADRVEQVSSSKGPSAGFDILSFEADGSERYIESKTTKYGQSTPFFITPNEVDFSRDHKDKYYIYRVFMFRENPRMFKLPGYVEDHCIIKPTEFIASIGR